MSNTQVIIKSKANALVEGTFTTELTKAVLYRELSGNPAFIVSSINSVSNTNYTAEQALLEADVTGITHNPAISPSAATVTLDAYVDGAYDGSPVSGSVSFSYVDLSGFTVSKTSGILTATLTTGGTNTVNFTIDQNETTSAISPVGTITVTGHGVDGTNVTLVITVNQAAGVQPSLVISPATQDIAADGTSASATFTIINYIKLDSIANKENTGNITEVRITND